MSMQNKTCGLVMPISAIDDCPADHWIEVKELITDAISTIVEYQFEINIVSDADEVGVIQKRIVQNLYKSDIVICDVSGKNPNVMFELGLRLAFDKPTVIVKDDKTDYSFDTGVVEHVSYRRDLRYQSIIAFKKKLASKVIATMKAAETDPEHSTFLKNFGTFHVATLKENEVSSDKVLFEMLSDIQNEMSMLRRRLPLPSFRHSRRPFPKYRIEDAVKEWQTLNQGRGLKEVIGDSDFYEFIEGRIDARNHFSSREQFKDELERYIFSQLPTMGQDK